MRGETLAWFFTWIFKSFIRRFGLRFNASKSLWQPHRDFDLFLSLGFIWLYWSIFVPASCNIVKQIALTVLASPGNIVNQCFFWVSVSCIVDPFSTELFWFWISVKKFAFETFVLTLLCANFNRYRRNGCNWFAKEFFIKRCLELVQFGCLVRMQESLTELRDIEWDSWYSHVMNGCSNKSDAEDVKSGSLWRYFRFFALELLTEFDTVLTSIFWLFYNPSCPIVRLHVLISCCNHNLDFQMLSKLFTHLRCLTSQLTGPK